MSISVLAHRAPTWLFAFSLAVFLPAAPVALAQPAPQAPQEGQPAPDDDAKKAEAKARFEKGLALFEQRAWDPALAEFSVSRSIFNNRSATKNAALCLRNLQRYDEAVDMFEALVRDFPDLADADKELAKRSITELASLVGALTVSVSEAGATVVVDGRTVGTSPLAGAVRVSAGTRSVRAYKEGFAPFETRVVVAGNGSAAVQAKLVALLRAGRLEVVEQGGRKAKVVVDGLVVGETPWSGSVAPGDHVVALAGGWHQGSPPAAAPVRWNQTTPLTLVLEDLPAELRVEPSPAVATVEIDGVVVGKGTWEGRLRTGDHVVEVVADGYQPATFRVRLDDGEHENVSATLVRLSAASTTEPARRGAVVVELDGALGLSPSLGGVVGCDGDCDRGAGVVVSPTLHVGYRMASRFVVGLAAGYLGMGQERRGRDATLQPVGRPPSGGTVTDTLAVRGLVVGATAGAHLGDRFPLTLRLGAGALVGSAEDARTGTFTSSTGTSYRVDATETHGASFLWVEPQARLGVRIGEHLELSAGLGFAVLVRLGAPAWQNETPLVAGDDGLATFPADEAVGGAIVALLPGVGAAWAF